MDIMYTCDNNYVLIMGISMISLFENNKIVDEINIHLLGDEISSDNKKILESIAKQYGRTFDYMNVPNLNIPDTLYNQRWPKSAYTRLFSSELLPKKIKKILYLDCDTIITRDISELWNIDITEFTIYGIKDCIGKVYKENIGLNANSIYINAGVLLINIDKLRKVSVSELIDEFLKKYGKLMNYSDQDVLNGIFNGKIGILNPKYDVMTLLYAYKYNEIKIIRRPTNYYTKKEINEAIKEPVIIHFTTCMLNVRPWYKGSQHPFAYEFINYKQMSPWANRQEKEVKFDSIQEKIMCKILKTPKIISLPIIGIMHTIIKPYLIRIRAKKILKNG